MGQHDHQECEIPDQQQAGGTSRNDIGSAIPIEIADGTCQHIHPLNGAWPFRQLVNPIAGYPTHTNLRAAQGTGDRPNCVGITAEAYR